MYHSEPENILVKGSSKKIIQSVPMINYSDDRLVLVENLVNCEMPFGL